MSFEEIISSLKSGKHSPIYLLHGEESYYIDKIVGFAEKNILSESEQAFNQMILYGKDIDYKTVIDEARQFPMMSERRLVIIKEAQDMKTLKDLDSYAEKPSPHTILIISHKHKKFDSRTKLAKAIKSNGAIFESNVLYDNQVQAWITNYLKSKSVTISADAALLAAEFLGTDLSKIANEMDKVILNSAPNIPISVEKIREEIGISKDYNVFELQKAIGSKDTEKSFRIVDYFAANEKANPLPMVMTSLYGYFYKVFVTSYHIKKNDNDLKTLLGLPTPYFVKEYRSAAQNYNGAKLINIFEALKDADLKSKGVGARNMESGQILKDFLIRVFYV